MGIYYSTGSFSTSSLTEIISIAFEYGINIELSSGVVYSPSIRETLMQAKGLSRFLVHNYFPPPRDPFVLNLASTDSSIHQKSLQLCRESIELCAEMKVPFYSVHAGFAFHLMPEDLGNPETQRVLSSERYIPREQASQRFLETIGELACYAKARDVGLLIENNVATCENLDDKGDSPLLLANVNEICQFFSDLNDPWVRLLLDIGHAKVSARTFGVKPESYFKCLASHIEALHLSDNDGLRDTHQAFDEFAWFRPFLKNFKSKDWVLEVSRLSPEEMIAQRRILEKMSN